MFMDFITVENLKSIISECKQKECSFIESANPESDLYLTPKDNLFPNPITLRELEEELNSNKTNLELWAIYLIFADKDFKYEEIKSSYENAKSKNFKMSRMPSKEAATAFEKSDKKCLYVGSSQNLKKRLEEHLEKSESTYSLHLKAWFPRDKKLSLQIIEVEKKDQKIMQLYEDFLWENFKPLFGRQGKK